VGWEEAVGSSGSAKALVDILELNGSVGRRHHPQGLESCVR
jgi:hypothetical protein